MSIRKLVVLKELAESDKELDVVETEVSELQKSLEEGAQDRYEYIEKFLGIPTWEKEALKKSFSGLLDNYKRVIFIQRKLLEGCRKDKIFLMQKLKNEIELNQHSRFSEN